MTNAQLIEYLRSHDACEGALQWLGDRDLSTCWQECQRGDWMMWLLYRAYYDDATMRRITCALVRRTPLADGRTVWDMLTDPRSRTSVEVAERYADGKATDEELRAARDAAAGAAAAARHAAAAARDAAWAVQADIVREFVPIIEIGGDI